MSFAVQIQQLWASLRSAVTRGIVSSSNDEKATQTLQADLRFDEASSDIEHFQPFGLSFRPTSKSEVIVLATGASQDNLVALAATDRSIRPTDVEEGEGGLYTPTGWKVFCNENDEVHLSVKEASQSFMRGEEVKAALKTYASNVSAAIKTIKITGDPGSDNGTIAAAGKLLDKHASSLENAINDALSDKVKGE